MPSEYATAYIDINESYLEQIRKMVNLLMVLSMLLSIVSPIYTPLSGAPSYTFFDGLGNSFGTPAAQPLAELPMATQPSSRQAPRHIAASAGLPVGTAPLPAPALGAALAPAWFAATAAPRPATNSTLGAELGTTLAPTWLASTTPQPAAALAAPAVSW